MTQLMQPCEACKNYQRQTTTTVLDNDWHRQEVARMKGLVAPTAQEIK